MKKYVCCSLETNQVKKLENPDINDEGAIAIFKALTHPLRIKILRLLTVEAEICNCDLTDLFDESQPAVSKQLSKLEKSGIIIKRNLTFEKTKGRWNAYRLAEDKKELLCHLLEPFTQKVPGQTTCSTCDDK